MLYNSYVFCFAFLPLVLCAYYFLNKYRKFNLGLALLLISSLIFYSYDNFRYVILLIGSIIINWFLSRLLNKKRSKIYLFLGIGINVAIIFYFKYLDFFLDNINKLFNFEFSLREILLPLGISFITFQQISYIVDSYRGETTSYSFIEYAAFISFFPQLIAGPIVLHKEIIPQFRNHDKKLFCHESFAKGIYAFSIGLFKKVIVADTFNKAVSWGWTNYEQINSLEIIVIMLSYTFQIYFDFSGYSEMAYGIGKMFNIDIPINFDCPYQSFSIIEFWKKWHITLTRFLREYVYFPLGGSQKGKIRTYLNILIVFFLSGLWHGANWTFIFWGAMHGLAQVLNRIFATKWKNNHPVLQWIGTFIFVNVMWLFFRANSIGQAWELLIRVAKVDMLPISSDLCKCFILPEINWLVGGVAILTNLVSKVNGFYMWALLLVSLGICLNESNINERKFRPTFFTAVKTSFLLLWSIISFSGVSVFLYFNF